MQKEHMMLSLRNKFMAMSFLLLTGFLVGCGTDSRSSVLPSESEFELSLLALGDSYTVGHSLPVEWSWPYQLADSLAAAGDSLRILDVIAQTGWTTRDLLDSVRDSLAVGAVQSGTYGLVTLMIGVNNQFQGMDARVMEAELDTLITLALNLTGDDPSRVFGFSIPDYGVTPMGERFGRERIAVEIEAYNVILARKFGDRGIVMLDITTVSRQAEAEPELIARDDLHYSREMYRRWVELMLPTVRSCLGLKLRSVYPD